MTDNEQPTITVAVPNGVCGGVKRALDAVEKVLSEYRPPIYVLHEIVHNNFIVGQLKRRGVIFAENLEKVPDRSVLLFSAHGVSAAVEQRAREKNCLVIDATCPLVKKLHRLAAEPSDILLVIGHREHPEVLGTLGRSSAKKKFVISSLAEAEQLPDFTPRDKITLLAQTTVSTDEVDAVQHYLKTRYPQLADTEACVCYATEERQRAARDLAGKCDIVLVIGSAHSSNSRRLQEVAQTAGKPAFLIDGPEDLPWNEIHVVKHIGVTAGASAPEQLVRNTLETLKRGLRTYTAK